MKRLSIWLVFFIAVAATVVGCEGGGDSASSGKAQVVTNEDDLAARVEDWTLTKDFLYSYVAQLPEIQRIKYDTPGGRAEVADRFIQEELFYREAKSTEELRDLDYVKTQLEDAERHILVAAYFKEYIEKQARPTEEELQDYYDSHQDQYTSLEVIRAQHIFSKDDPDKLLEFKERIVEGGEKMTTLAHQHSEDTVTKRDGGDLGFFNPGGYIRFVGYSEAFSDTVFKMETGKVYGPIKWEKGWSLVRVNERRPPELKPFAEVREEISDILTQANIEEVKEQIVEKIREKYDVKNYMDDFYRSISRSPEELWELATASDDAYERIRAFEEISEKYPDHELAPQAMFMVGFVYAEELTDKVRADRAFHALINTYPEVEVTESARWMVNNMDKSLPKFEDLDDLNNQLQQESE